MNGTTASSVEKPRSRRPGRVQWARELKITLHVLHQDFNFTLEKTTRIFNALYKDYMSSCGVPQGIAEKTLRTQYAERKKPNTAHWTSILQTNLTDEEKAEREAIKARIRAVDDHRVSTPLTKKRTTRRLKPAAPLSITSSSQSIPHQERTQDIPTPPCTPAKDEPRLGRKRHSNCTPKSAAPKSSPKSTLSRKATRPKVPMHRNDGTVIMVSKQRLERIVTEVEPVPEHKAHPPLPAILIRSAYHKAICVEVTKQIHRHWHKDPTCDRDSENGFQARKYYRSNVIAHIAPKSAHIDPTDVFNHLDRKFEKSPFISTCSRLIWILQLLLKEAKDGVNTGRLSVVDTRALDPRIVFHARPFHDAIRKTSGFSNGPWLKLTAVHISHGESLTLEFGSKGAQHYRGTYEYLVWRKIPKDAIITTFRAEDLMLFADSNEVVASILHLDILRLQRRNLARTKIPMLRQSNGSLNSQMTGGLADLCIFFGLDAHSPREHLSHIISDLIGGWQVHVGVREDAEWYDLASLFAGLMCERTTPSVPFKEREMVKHAFLDGKDSLSPDRVSWGCGDVNAKHKPELIHQKQRKAAAVGLSSPATIIANQLDAAKLSILSYEKAHTRRLETYHQRAAIEAPSNLDETEMDLDVEDEEDYGDDDEMDVDASEEHETPRKSGSRDDTITVAPSQAADANDTELQPWYDNEEIRYENESEEEA